MTDGLSVIVFSSRGGGGHVAAAEAIKEAIGSIHQIETVNALSEVFKKVDLFSALSNKRFNGEDFYNFILKKRLFRMANLYGIVGKRYMSLNRRILADAASLFLEKTKPDLVISVIPYFNGAFQAACLKLGIPFIIIPTDIELSSFISGLNFEKIDDKFKLCLGYDLQIKKALDAGFARSNILRIGFPVKKACVDQYDASKLKTLKKQLKLSLENRVITLTLGAAGTSHFFKFSKAISKLSYQDLDIICCAGKDRRSFNRLSSYLEKNATLEFISKEHHIFKLPSGCRMHIRSFTKDLPSLMAASDLIISKTGSLSVSEALHLKKYLLVDHTLNSSSRKLFWERPNIDFIRSLNQGDGFFSIQDLIQKVESFLNSPLESDSKDRFLNFHDLFPEAVFSALD